MRLFHWLCAGEIPPAWDLRRYGWQLTGSEPQGSSAVALAPVARMDRHAWSRLRHAFPRPQHDRVLLLGVGDSLERARLLELGFGDVPCETTLLGELAARAERAAQRAQSLPRYREIGRLQLDLLARDGFVNGKPLALHPREFALLWRLADTPGVALSKRALLSEVWRLCHVPDTNSLAVHVFRLRSKLAGAGLDGLVRTAPAGGYMLAAPAESETPAISMPAGDPHSDDLVVTGAATRSYRMSHEFAANDRVRLAIEQGIAQVTLTRSDKLNALDPAMFDALLDAGQALFDLPGLRCVVLSGKGRGFSAGLDLSTFAAVLGGEALPLAQRTHGNANGFQQAAMQWRKLPVPVIAAVHGVCFGGALQIAGGADIRVVAPDARLAVMEMKWGIVPDMGGFALWRGCVRDDVLRELTYTNREFSGEEALTYGFATVVDADPLQRAMTMAREIAARSPDAVRAAKSLFNRSADLPLDDILAAESFEQGRLLGSRNQLEAVTSQTQGRPANFVDR